MRFAWFRKQDPDYQSQAQHLPHPAAIARVLYNLAFWLFLVPLFTPMSYGTGFMLFAVVIAIRLGANLFHNNLMEQSPEAFDRMPLRIP